ncbi:Methyltransferase domain-containing protein [Algoriella xinjiangensis]|uniref:Methyltransferase domain-containing protein n=1 Tax=Algoriella xinjiangensis TaxID=684065 RepID=A0A1I4VEA3_9FLAO|nr:methyltransferase domain-containing protein [Algoriella xinjiangensis]SFM99564.1 Methyltransferase domain-containing protein [Algoriella xinjiangensis]
MKYINLGCGPKYSTDKVWLNADMSTTSKDVIECNFLNGIPFGDAEFDTVYHSHVIEHFSKKDAVFFISECFRVLKPNGIIRIACPNLEVIAREYLNNLERANNNVQNADEDYDWIMLELYDQTVRNKSGGDMLNYFKKKEINNIDYVANRIGNVVREWYNSLRGQEVNSDQKFLAKKFSLSSFFSYNNKENELEQNYSEIGKFRLGGEIHQWMYDRFSLKRLLEKVGFKDVIVRTATESYIESWSSYQLDNPEETASIFIEARKA